MVTGASSGLGAAIALALGALGWPVALGARRFDRIEELARQVEASGGKALPHTLDITEESSIDAFVSATEAALGPVEVVVSNAGISQPGQLPELSIEQIQGEIETNLIGPLRLVRRTLPALLEQRSGDICFISSLNTVAPRPLQIGYTASKAGLEGAVRTLQMELEGTGVRATILRPGPAKSEMGYDWKPELQELILAKWKRWGLLRHMHFMTPEHIAQALVAIVTAPPGVQFDVVQVNPSPQPE
jgi:NADP-dependent 3-hydroxy acid dehydrogenase YdfG